MLPFTKHEKNNIDFILELSEFVNSIEIKSELKYIIELSQILSEGTLFDYFNIRNELTGD